MACLRHVLGAMLPAYAQDLADKAPSAALQAAIIAALSPPGAAL
jgi:hypothetical protein